MLCKYKDIFGKPNEGFHEARIFGLAFWDLFGTFIIIIIASYYFSTNVFVTGINVFLFTIIVHKIFCVETALNKKIFS